MAPGKSWAFWRSDEARSTGESQRSSAKAASAGPRAIKWLPFLFIWPIVGLAGIALYALHIGSGSVLAVALLVAGASFLVGSFLGLLFGIPRWLAIDRPSVPGQQPDAAADPNSAQATAPGHYSPNTNLEQISDWLTKALVGVGLVELKSLAGGMQRLVDFLAPGLGGVDSSPVFAGAVVVGYSVTGFIVAYLVTRIYLGRAFAEADDLTQRLHKVEEVQQEQEKNLAALNLVTRYLEAEASDSSITQDSLDAAVTAAGDLVRIQIFNMARQRRRQPGSLAQRKRVIGVFRALIAADTDALWHRNHGQLGYALHAIGDFSGAEDAFTTAIQRRDGHGQRGYQLYEMMRALSRVALDQAAVSNATKDHPSEPQVVDEILIDLRKAARSRGLRNSIQERHETDARLRDWALRNKLTVADLTERPSPNPPVVDSTGSSDQP